MDFGAWAVNLRPNWHQGGIQSIAALGRAMARENKTLNLRRSFRQGFTSIKEPRVPEGIQLFEGLGKVLTSLSPHGSGQPRSCQGLREGHLLQGLSW